MGRRMPPRRSYRDHWLVILLVVLCIEPACCKTPSSSLSPRSLIPQQKKPAKTFSKLSKNSNKTSVVQLIETEIWDGSHWKAGKFTQDGQPTNSPDQQQAPEGTIFQGDWKIVTSKSRDAYGWEYQATKQPTPRRQRIWLRSIVADESVGTKRRRTQRPRWMQALTDEFNFKGFGISFFKSLVFKDGCGISIRMPLTLNWNAWERHPALPAVSTSVAAFYPNPTGVVFLNASLRVEWIQWATARLFFLLQYSIVWLGWIVTRGVVVAGSALVYPVTRTFYAPPNPFPWQSAPPCDYSRTTEERIGTSWSWRYSADRGYEFRVSYWHYYAPTLVSVLQTVGRPSPAWLTRHTAAWGLTTSGPVPDSDPFIVCSTLLSFSGFYWKRKSRNVRVEQQEDDSDDVVVGATKSASSSGSSSSSSIKGSSSGSNSTKAVADKGKGELTSSKKRSKVLKR